MSGNLTHEWTPKTSPNAPRYGHRCKEIGPRRIVKPATKTLDAVEGTTVEFADGHTMRVLVRDLEPRPDWTRRDVHRSE